MYCWPKMGSMGNFIVCSLANNSDDRAYLVRPITALFTVVTLILYLWFDKWINPCQLPLRFMYPLARTCASRCRW